jgi:hypothetical protein
MSFKMAKDEDFFIDEQSGIAIVNGKRYYGVGVSDDNQIVASKHENKEEKDDEELTEEYLRARGTDAEAQAQRHKRTDDTFKTLAIGDQDLAKKLAAREGSWQLNHEMRASGDLRGIPPRNYFSQRSGLMSSDMAASQEIMGPRQSSSVYLMGTQKSTSLLALTQKVGGRPSTDEEDPFASFAPMNTSKSAPIDLKGLTLPQKIQFVKAKYAAVEQSVKPPLNWTQMCLKRWELLEKLHQMVEKAPRPHRKIQDFAEQQIGPLDMLKSKFISTWQKYFNLDVFNSTKVLASMFHSYDLIKPQQELESADFLVHDPRIDTREVLCGMIVLNAPLRNTMDKLMDFFHIFDPDQSETITFKNCMVMVMSASINEFERAETGQKMQKALREHATDHGMKKAHYDHITKHLFYDVLKKNPDILSAVESQMWARLQDERRMDLVKQKGDEIEARFEQLNDARKRDAAMNMFKNKLMIHVMEQWTSYVEQQKAVCLSQHRNLTKKQKRGFRWWHEYAKTRHEYRHEMMVADVIGKKFMRMNTWRRWWRFIKNERRLRAILRMGSFDMMNIRDGCRKVGEMQARKHKHVCFYVWDSATREAGLQLKAPLVILQKLRRKVFMEWRLASKKQAIENKEAYEAEMRQQEIMGMMRDADANADAAEEEEDARLVAEEQAKKDKAIADRKYEANMANQRAHLQNFAADKAKAMEQLEKQRARRRQELQERADAFEDKWDVIEAEQTDAATNKAELYLATRQGKRGIDIDARRLEKVMTSPPQDQGAVLQAALKSEEGGGQPVSMAREEGGIVVCCSGVCVRTIAHLRCLLSVGLQVDLERAQVGGLLVLLQQGDRRSGVRLPDELEPVQGDRARQLRRQDGLGYAAAAA